MTDCSPLLPVDWPAPPTVTAWVSSRQGEGSYGGFNLADHVGDDTGRVQANRQRLAQLSGQGSVQWLNQVHSSDVARVCAAGPPPTADALYTRERGLGLAVLTADCLPVLFCSNTGDEVAAAHAGWRGLAGGVLEATLAEFTAPPADVMAWLGPAISKTHFEVGAEVRDAFLGGAGMGLWDALKAAFRPSARDGHYYCDLYQLARIRLVGAGITRVYGGSACTYSEAGRYYSYRRDGITGRMATLIALA